MIRTVLFALAFAVLAGCSSKPTPAPDYEAVARDMTSIMRPGVAFTPEMLANVMPSVTEMSNSTCKNLTPQSRPGTVWATEAAMAKYAQTAEVAWVQAEQIVESIERNVCSRL